ncbi:uncharacterized protein LOC129741819 [Uranotaenia lowii]|uniref:uncharacterized protein LOC129741819 n=1 Tax=Uranotaenia lowii TaxID=190385 RepID=UPI0024792972|nr:uncharacterized protein LOC129741819 [Uranotaenia lowii]
METPNLPEPAIPSAPTPLILCYFFHICASDNQGPQPSIDGSSSVFDGLALGSSLQEYLDAFATFPNRIDAVQRDFDSYLAKLKASNPNDQIFQDSLLEIGVKLRELTDAIKADYQYGLIHLMQNPMPYLIEHFTPWAEDRATFVGQTNALISSGTPEQKSCAKSLVINFMSAEFNLLGEETQNFASVLAVYEFYYVMISKFFYIVVTILKVTLNFFSNPGFSGTDMIQYFNPVYETCLNGAVPFFSNIVDIIYYLTEGVANGFFTSVLERLEGVLASAKSSLLLC